MNETTVTLVGNLTNAPELRFTPSGKAVANFTVACTPRRKEGDKWVDGTTTFWRCELWNEPAEHAAEALARGQRVILTGIIRTETWTDKEQVERRDIRVVVDDIGASLKFGRKGADRTSTPADEPAF